MRILITENQLNELVKTNHFIERLNQRVGVKYLDVVLIAHFPDNKIDQVVGKFIMTPEIKTEIQGKIDEIESLRFPPDEKIGVVLYDFNLRNIDQIQFNSKEDKFYTKKLLKSGYGELFILDPKVTVSKSSQGMPKGQMLMAVIKGSSLVTLYYAKYNRLESEGIYDKLAWDMDDLREMAI